MSKCSQCPYIVGDSYQRDCEFPDCSGGWEEVYKDAAKEITRLRDEVEKHKKVLSELCRLRAIRDHYGKTDEYVRCRPLAWDAAFELIIEEAK